MSACKTMVRTRVLAPTLAMFTIFSAHALGQSPPVVVLSERDFGPGSVTTATNGWANVGTFSAASQASGGNPGGWLLVSVGVAAGTPASPFTGNTTYGTIFLAGRTIDPAAIGGIGTLTVTADSRFVRVIPSNTVGCDCSGQQALVRQNGIVYAANMPNTAPAQSAWHATNSAVLTAAAFQRVLFQNPMYFDPAQRPDFSSTGAPIEVGMSRGNSNGPAQPFAGYALETGLDNLVITATGCALISGHPGANTMCRFGSVGFSVTAAGIGPLAYQWQIEDAATPGGWIDLANGSIVRMGTIIGSAAGTTTPFVIITGAVDGNTDLDATRVRCIVSNACGRATSNAAILTICIADTDDGTGTGACDGGVGIEDLLYYLQRYDAGC